MVHTASENFGGADHEKELEQLAACIAHDPQLSFFALGDAEIRRIHIQRFIDSHHLNASAVRQLIALLQPKQRTSAQRVLHCTKIFGQTMWELVCDVIADNGKKKTSMDRNPKQRVAAFVLALQEWLETNVS